MMLAQRRDLRRLLPSLTPEQWETPSLCGEWTVRELVTHLVGWDDLIVYRSRREHVRALLRFSRWYAASLGSMDRLNRRIQRRTGDLDADALVRRFAADDGDDLGWLFDGTNPGAHLAEYAIHAQDLCRPLGLPVPVDAERLVAALHGALQLPGVRLHAPRLLLRTRLQATDVPWARGRGPVRELPGIDALLLLAGR